MFHNTATLTSGPQSHFLSLFMVMREEDGIAKAILVFLRKKLLPWIIQIPLISGFASIFSSQSKAKAF